MDKLKQPLRIRKPKQPLGKFNNFFRKSKQPFRKSRLRKTGGEIPLRQYLLLRRKFEFRRTFRYFKYRLRKQFFRSKRFFIRSRNQIHFKNISVISRFIGFQGKIIPRRVTKLSLRQQRLMTAAIKKARILCFLPFLENEIHFRKRWQQILKRRRQNQDKNQDKRRSRKNRPKYKPGRILPKTEPKTILPKTEMGTTHPKTEPKTIHPKTESRRIHPKTESRTIHPKTESRRIHPKTESRTIHPKTETGTTGAKTEPRTTRPKTKNP